MILLDTHALFWLQVEPGRLSRRAAGAIRVALRRGGLAIASISLWELAQLASARRIEVEGSIEGFLNRLAGREDLAVLEITPEIAVLAAQLPDDFPGDPADRIIAGTARAYGLELVTKDQRMHESPLLKAVW